MKAYYQEDGITIYHGDCLDILPQLPKVDLVVTDPPYGCNKAGWDNAFPVEWYRLARAQASMVVIITGSEGLKDSIPLVGEDFVDVIAARNLNGMTRGPIGFGNWLAAVIAGAKPKQGINCFSFSIMGMMADHPSPKPLSYMVRLISRLMPDGGGLCDPFAGSGTTLKAAKDLGISAIGIEIEEKYCEIAAERLSQGVLDLVG